MKRYSLRLKIIINIAIITVSAIILIGILSVKIIENYAVSRKMQQGETIIKAVQSIYQQDSNIRNFVSRLAERGEIEGIIIVNEDKRVIFSYGANTSIPTSEDIKEASSSMGIAKEVMDKGWFGWLGSRIVLLSGLPLGDGSRVIIRITISLLDVKEDIAKVQGFIFFYAVLDSFLIIVFGAFLISRSIIKPIESLHITARDIADGNLEKRAEIYTRDEIGSLAESFNVMTEKLKSNIDTLRRLNRELVSAQEDLLRSEKLAAVGRLSAGVAHEIGNPLGAVLGYIDILKKGPMDKTEEKDILDRLEKETARINMIVKEFLDMSRPGGKQGVIDTEKLFTNVNKIVDESVRLVEMNDDFRNIRFDKELGEGLKCVGIDENRLKQVIINVLLNAKDAMPNGGLIRIETVSASVILKEPVQRRRDDSPDINVASLRKGRDMVSIKISDTGCGIMKEDLNKIFDPFFTTKEIGRGTGLGLSISLGIIQAYGGDMRVESEIGKGTTFEIILPIIDSGPQT